MKAYLAASYSQRERMNDQIAPSLRVLGYEIVSTWIDGHHEVPGRQVDNGTPEYNASPDEIRGWATEDVLDLMAADFIIQFTDTPSHRGGAHVELGFCLGAGKEVCIIGPRVNVFHYLEAVQHFETWEEALPRFKELARISADV